MRSAVAGAAEVVHNAVMTTLSEQDLKTIVLDAAQGVADLGPIEAIEVVAHDDWDGDLGYYYALLIDRETDPERRAMAHVRLEQRIRDALLERGDAALPYVRVLNQRDWDVLGHDRTF